MTTSTVAATQTGTAQEKRPGPFLIHDPGALWTVTSGYVDLFLTPVANGEPSGARSPVLRVNFGENLFGVSTGAAGGFALIAVPGPGAVVETGRADQLFESVNALLPEGAWGALERWIDRLALAASDRPSPSRAVRLQPGPQTISGGEKGKTVTAEHGVLWARCTLGKAAILSRKRCPAAPLLPVSPAAWLDIAAESQVEIVSRDQARATLLESLDAFHRLCFEMLIENREAAGRRFAEQQAGRAEADGAAIDTAMRRLDAVIDHNAEAFRDEEHFNDPLFLACREVGRALGVTMRPHPDMRRGIKLADPVVSLARASGVRYRRVILKDTWWRFDQGPLLAFFEGSQAPVALTPRKRARGYDIYDPTADTRKPVDAEIAARLQPVGYMFYRPFPHKALGMKDLLEFGLRPCMSDGILIALMGIVAGMLGALTPVMTGVIFDTIIPGAQRPQLIYVSAFLVVAAISTTLLGLVRGFAMLRMEGRMEASMQAAVWDRLLDLPVPFFRDYSSGDLALRGMSISQIRQTLTGSTLTSILGGVFSIFSFGLLFYYNWRLALVATGLTVVAAAVSGLIGHFQVHYQRDIARSRGKLTSSVLQLLQGIAKLRVSGTENRAFARWARDFSQQKLKSMQSQTVSNGLTIFNTVYPLVCTACIFGMIAHFMTTPDAPQMSTGDFVAFQAAFMQFLSAALQVTSAMVSVLNIVPIYERSAPILHTLPEVDRDKSSPGELTGRLEVNHLAFRYTPEGPLVLHDISLKVEPGQFVAIVGGSGSGKSTLLRLMLGFEKPGSGSIYYDGQDLSNLDVQTLRQKLGVVLQGGKLFTGDIFTNIVGALPLSIEDAWEAARLAGFDQDIKAMPMGMFTVVSEGGGTLSGGQRQRLLIARAIVKKPRVIFFDEATSALDNQTQAIVSQSLEAMNATRVVIAHRLSTIANADRIFVLNQGLVAQSGTFQELLHQEGLFRDLASRQMV